MRHFDEPRHQRYLDDQAGVGPLDYRLRGVPCRPSHEPDGRSATLHVTDAGMG